MDVLFTPSVCSGERKTFTGALVLRVPTFDERYQYMEECGVVGETVGIGAIRKAVKLSAPHYVKVDLKRDEDGKVFSSFEDLAMDSGCDSILIEVSTKILNGFRLGKI